MQGISAVVATYQRTTVLQRLLESIKRNGITSIEVIIVDQNLNNLIDEIIKDYKDEMQIIHLKMNQANQSKARNYGASFAKYPIICFPDDDCWYDDNALTLVMENFNKINADLLIIKWKQDPSYKLNSGFLNKKIIHSFRAVGYATITVFFKKNFFNKIKGFDESIGLGKYIGGGEDTDILFKSVKYNGSVYYDSLIYVNHDYVAIETRTNLDSIRARQRGIGLVYYKYKLPAFILIRSFISPLIKMIISLNTKKIQAYYNMLIGRFEGYRYGIKNRNSL